MSGKVQMKDDIIKDLASQIISDQEEIQMPETSGDKTQKTKEGDDFTKDFNLRPKDLEQYLNNRVVDQESSISILATEVCTFYNTIRDMKARDEDPMDLVDTIKPNIVVVGPTGCGKTYSIKLIADKLGVPFIKGDATKFSETGYVGGDVEDLIRDLVKEADGDITKAQYGIVYIDEIDKIAEKKWNGQQDHVSRSGVQRGLLKMMEETDVDLKIKLDIGSQVEEAMKIQKGEPKSPSKINTKNILFIVSGAFADLEDMIRKNDKKEKSMGFGGTPMAKDAYVDLKQVEEKPQDLVDYGFESEFVGRLPIITVFDQLSEQGLVKILDNPKSSVTQQARRDFRAYGIDVSISGDAKQYIASKAIEMGTGARALVTVMYKALRDYKKELPDTGITSFNITKDIIEEGFDKVGLVKELALHTGFIGYTQMLKAAYGAAVEMTQDVKEQLMGEVRKNGKSAYQRCQQAFSALEKELKEIAGYYEGDRPDVVAQIELNKDYIDNPDVQTELMEPMKLYAVADSYARHISQESGVDVSFDDDAISALGIAAGKANQSPAEFCTQQLGYMAQGFEVLKRQNPDFSVVLGREAIDDPEGFVNDLFSEYYSEKKE